MLCLRSDEGRTGRLLSTGKVVPMITGRRFFTAMHAAQPITPESIIAPQARFVGLQA
ncbi:hypothetical protein Asbog_00452 [Asaia bogorensis NBRC 16594]|uniref:Uncharacterized protein n=1 Tax=Asaia bogorensis NBRC 16594 TaxID=1231624 RepID=A0AAN4R248_9PROT|nr:hypothetical protein Asbog_00452 [Asaia bogorensis NBRC 16594]GEL53115.1 hypothetical protein ABO01nite_11220 [Asaia bogorensis NBRC 16594]